MDAELHTGERCVGVLGATSMVGECLLPLLTEAGRQVAAYSRQACGQTVDGVEWRRLVSTLATLPLAGGGSVSSWVCLAPIWVLPDYFGLLEAQGARRVVALSSTSIVVKGDSSNPGERGIARRLDEGEQALRAWAESRGIQWVILRPTLIYGRGQDKNLTEIVLFIRRWGFFPLLGQADGLRQPVHAEDVAAACLSALALPVAANRTYNLSGGETLSYREMVCRVFATVGKLPHLVTIPRWLFQLAVTALRLLPRYRHWTVEMAQRMNRDLVFGHADAARDLGFSPRPFVLSPEDLPA